MPSAIGSRRCPVLGCQRSVHVTAGGTVFGRCVAHTLAITSRAFATPSSEPERGVPPSPRSDSLPVAVPAYRPAA